mgnify:CR=1 FL=1
MTSVALLAQDDLAAVFAWRPEGPVSVADYLADVHALAGRLPARSCGTPPTIAQNEVR